MSRAELWEVPAFRNPADREESEPEIEDGSLWRKSRGVWSVASHMNHVFLGEQNKNSHLCQTVLKIPEKYSNTEFGHMKLFSDLNKSHLSRVGYREAPS